MIRKNLITFLVGFLSHSSNHYVSRRGLELTIEDLFEEFRINEQERQEMQSMLGKDASSLLDTQGKYFHLIKYAILSFIKR